MILLAGGTTEAIEIALALDRAQRAYVMTVATGYGCAGAEDRVKGRVLKGPFDSRDFEKILNDYSIDMVIDASHVYAGGLRRELAGAAQAAGIRLARFERPPCPYGANPDVACFEDWAALGAWAREKDFKRIFISSGVKGLQSLAGVIDPGRMFVRLLPSGESLTTALNAGLKPDHIIAMEGPFSADLNEALFRHLRIDLLVTKDSGGAGGFKEKIEAAARCGCRVAVLSRPEPAPGEVFHDTGSLLQSLGITPEEGAGWHVILLGHGSRLATANQGLKLVAEELGRRGQYLGVKPAFLQHAAPSLADVFQELAASGAARIVIMPLFLFEGVHITSDIPEEIQKIRGGFPHLQVVQARFIGPDPLLAEICLRRISDAIMKV